MSLLDFALVRFRVERLLWDRAVAGKPGDTTSWLCRIPRVGSCASFCNRYRLSDLLWLVIVSIRNWGTFLASRLNIGDLSFVSRPKKELWVMPAARRFPGL
jgi:hypothetical protein